MFPDWDMQPLSAEASVRLMLDLIGKWEKADSGAIISHKGNKEWF